MPLEVDTPWLPAKGLEVELLGSVEGASVISLSEVVPPFCLSDVPLR